MGDVLSHEQTLTFRVPEWVPGHEKRGHDMPDFEHNRQQLINDGHGYCYRCAIAGIDKRDDLQCHHLSEWAEWNDMDAEAVLRMAKAKDPYGYAAKMGDEPISNPNDIRLLLFLCQPCHTGKPKNPEEVTSEPTDYISGGIHYCAEPFWWADAMRVRKAKEATT